MTTKTVAKKLAKVAVKRLPKVTKKPVVLKSKKATEEKKWIKPKPDWSTDFGQVAMLCIVTTASWSGRKYDKEISDDVAAQHKAEDKSVGRYNKRLLPKEAKTYKAVVAIQGKLRDIYYKYTLPWSDDGCRVLPCASFIEFQDAYANASRDFEQAVNALIEDYPNLMTQAIKQGESVLKKADFPDESILRKKFWNQLKYYPLPTSDDIRIDIPKEHLAAIKKQVAAETKEALEFALLTPYWDLFQVVEKLMQTLDDPDKKFKDSLFRNIATALRSAEKNNLGKDPELAKVIKRIQLQLVEGVEPEEMRKDKDKRSAKAEQAEAIFQDLRAVFTGIREENVEKREALEAEEIKKLKAAGVN